jgi:hypothetical protein
VNDDKPEKAPRRNTKPTMIAGGVDDYPIVLDEIVDAALSFEAHRALWDSALTVLDVVAGKVPGLDRVEIITEVWERVLEYDEYERCMRLLPDLLAEYGYPVE